MRRSLGWVLFLAACSSPPAEERIVGSWVGRDRAEGVDIRYEFRGDGTCGSLAQGAVGGAGSACRWSVVSSAGDELSLRVESAGAPADVMHVTFVDDDTFTTRFTGAVEFHRQE